MAKYQLISSEITQIMTDVYDYEAIGETWRSFLPVKRIPAAASLKYYVSDELPSGRWTTMTSGLTEEHFDIGAQAETEIQILCMRRDFSIPWTWVEMARAAKMPIDTRTIVDTRRKVAKDVDKCIYQGATTLENVSQKGLYNYTGVQSGTDGNGNSFSTAWGHLQEAYAALIAYGHQKPYALVAHTTFAKYMAHINTNGSATVLEAFTNFLGGKDQLVYVVTDNLAVDSSDTAYIMCKPDMRNMYVAEVTNGVETHLHNDGKVFPDWTIKGSIIWIGGLIIPRPKAVCECGGVASA